MVTVQAAGFTDIGKVRKANEDSYLLDESIGLYLVADGMGGHRGGGVASRIAVETIGTSMASSLDESTDDNDGLAVTPSDRLLQSIQLANRKIHEQSTTDEACRGMGTTVSALYFVGDCMITANVGDSPIYLLRNGEIEDLYIPHTLLHEYKKVPKSLEKRFSSAKLAHILTRAVGIRAEVKVDVAQTVCFADDIIVICSDGLSGKLSREEVRDLVYQNDVDAACKMLTELALRRGGEDNITVIVVRVSTVNSSPDQGLLKRIAGIPAWIASLFRTRHRG